MWSTNEDNDLQPGFMSRRDRSLVLSQIVTVFVFVILVMVAVDRLF